MQEKKTILKYIDTTLTAKVEFIQEHIPFDDTKSLQKEQETF